MSKFELNPDDKILHQPKGSMCASCQHHNSDCSDLDFDSMKVIGRSKNVIIVRCSNWIKRK